MTVDNMFSLKNPKFSFCITIIIVCIVPPLLRRSSADSNDTSTLAPVPVDLNDIGYGGTWERFCDTKEITNEFILYPEHDLKKLRLMLCILKAQNKIVRQALLAFTVYKYCLAVRPQLDMFMEMFLMKLSDGDEDRRTILLVPGSFNNTSSCYRETFIMFTKECAGDGNPCIKMFRLLLSRACNVPWLTSKEILSYIKEVCSGKFISDKVDWESILASIPYRE